MVSVAPDHVFDLFVGIVLEEVRIIKSLPSRHGVFHQNTELVAGVIECRIVRIMASADKIQSRLLEPFHIVVNGPFWDRIAQAKDVLMHVRTLRLVALPVDGDAASLRPLYRPDADTGLIEVNGGRPVFYGSIQGIEIGRIGMPEFGTSDCQTLREGIISPGGNRRGSRGGLGDISLRVDDIGDDRTTFGGRVFVDDVGLDGNRRGTRSDRGIGDENPAAPDLIGEHRVGNVEVVGEIHIDVAV